jgi:succinoglycan biosynthesis protein ExoO
MGRLLAAANHTNADVVFDNTMLCHDTPNGLSPWKALHGERAFGGTGTTARRIRIEDYISAERLLIHPIIRTDFIRKHGIRHSARRFAEDAEFYLRLAHAGAKFCYVPQPMYFYRITPGSLTAQAKDPSLMRKCLEECAGWPNWSPTAREAFRFKIATLRRNEILYEVRRLARTGGVFQAIRLLTSEPKALAALPGRLIRQLNYHLHRRLRGGAGRQ